MEIEGAESRDLVPCEVSFYRQGANLRKVLNFVASINDSESKPRDFEITVNMSVMCQSL